MIIARFGDTWAGAYAFSQVRAEDDWEAERPAVVARVGGAGGEFDFYGNEGFPVAPLIVTKTFDLESTYAGIETALNTLRAATIAAGRTKLWGELRDGSTRLWTWGKCVRLKSPEKAGGEYVNKRVELTFRCSEGLWYSESTVSALTYLFPGGGYNLPATNDGNFPALVRAAIVSPGNTITMAVTQMRNGGVTPECQWQFDAHVLSGNYLVVDAQLSQVTNNDVDAYDDLTVGTSAFLSSTTPQVAWLWLPAGAHSFYVDSSVIGANYTEFRFTWYHTYLM